MITDDVDHRRPGALGIVDVGAAIQEARAEVQQRHGRAAGDTGMTIGGAGGDAFKEAEHRVDAWLVIERGDEMHFGGAGISEAGGDAMVCKG